MGQKVNPISFRIGINKVWKSRWYANKKDYKKFLFEDITLRSALEKKLKMAGVDSVEIERLPKAMAIKLTVSRPGIVIGRGGSGIEEIKSFVLKILGVKSKDVNTQKIEIIVEEVKNPEVSARLVAQRIASEMERRMPHRRVVTRAIDRVMASGAKGIKIALSGRIEGAEIARNERYHTGSVPTQTLRSNIDYAHVHSLLKRGYVGVKVWIHVV